MRKVGFVVNKKRLARLMRENNIKAKTKRRFIATTVHNSKTQASGNILKPNFTALSVNRIWTGDITYSLTKEGRLNLAVVMDIYSRKIVSWSIDSSLSTDLVISDLMMAVLHRHPERGIIFHSDGGS